MWHGSHAGTAVLLAHVSGPVFDNLHNRVCQNGSASGPARTQTHSRYGAAQGAKAVLPLLPRETARPGLCKPRNQ